MKKTNGSTIYAQYHQLLENANKVRDTDHIAYNELKSTQTSLK